jgi:hypothetical protein
MDLEQDPPEPVENEPVSPQEGGDGGETVVEDTSPASEPVSGRQTRDDARESEARYWREEADRNRRELEQLRAAQRQDPREEQARIEAMDPEQRVLYFVEKGNRENQSLVSQIEHRTASQIDQLKFDAELDKAQRELGWTSAKRAQYSSEVEQFYSQLANQAIQSGTRLSVSRLDLLDHKIGREMRTNGARAVKTAAATGKANTARQATRMTPASSNVTGKSTGMTKAQESMKRMVEAGVLEM